MNLGKSAASGQRWELSSDALVTHGVILGMTGSGKTGLAITLLEELVDAGVPLVLIDPKGDLANLGLLFPQASAEELEPWVDPGEASRAGQSTREWAEAWSQKLQRGRLEWGIGPSQIESLRQKLDLQVYSPGARAATPVNLLGSFPCPDRASLEDPDARVQLVSGTILGLLALVEVEADPLRSPEAVVLSQILDLAWEQGQDLKLEDLILRLADPPFQKVGVFPLETFFPSNKRLDLAMKLNALLASPGFAPWCEGQPLAPESWFEARNGKVPVQLFYLAHLGEGQRQFFVSLLLHRLLAYSRSLPGRSSLKGLLYFDEVAGYMPPHPANPATKQPLLTLLKQSRAVGLGVVLATQNPVDLDYKGLANTGTWWIGRMQTAQDRARVAEGLLVSEAGMDSAALQREFEQLEARQFLVKSPRQGPPERVATRFAKAVLRGPLTKNELAKLGPPSQAAPPQASPPPVESTPGQSHPPKLPNSFQQVFLDPAVVFSAALEGAFEGFSEPRRQDGKLFWRPALWGELQVRFDEDKGGFVLDELHHYLVFPIEDRLPEQWQRLTFESQALLSQGEGYFEPLNVHFDEERELKTAQTALMEDVFRRVTSSQWVQADLKLYGAGGESEEQFRSRVEAAVEERIDAQVAKLHAKVEKELAALESRLARHESKLDNLRNEAQRRQSESLWTAGAAVLSFFTGKKAGISSALSRHNRSSSAKDRVSQSESEVSQLQQQMEDLQTQLEEQVEQIRAQERLALNKVEARSVRLERSDIRLNRFGVMWIPVTRRV